MKNSHRCEICNKRLNESELLYYGYTCEKCERHFITEHEGNKLKTVLSLIRLYFRKVIYSA